MCWGEFTHVSLWGNPSDRKKTILKGVFAFGSVGRPSTGANGKGKTKGSSPQLQVRSPGSLNSQDGKKAPGPQHETGGGNSSARWKITNPKAGTLHT